MKPNRARAGKGVFAMKAFGGGNLTGSYLEALDYVRDLPGVDSIMIGFGSKEEVDRIVEYAEGTIDPDYIPDVSRKRESASIREIVKDAEPVLPAAPIKPFSETKTVWRRSILDLSHLRLLRAGVSGESDHYVLSLHNNFIIQEISIA